MRGAVWKKLGSRFVPWRASSRYVRLLELGTGHSSRVALAVAAQGDGVQRLVVIKSVGEGPAGDGACAARLSNEARLMARMSHPNVVQVQAVCREKASPAIILEYLAGPSLAELVASANEAPEFSLELRIAIVTRLLAGLDYAHRLRDLSGGRVGVVHGAVSPDHVMVTYQGQVKLIDFGGARRRPLKPARPPCRRALPYLPPEHFRGEPDLRVDVFAAGAILWELVARSPLWGQQPMLTVLRRVRAGNMPRLRDAVPGVDVELEQICRRALAPRPDDRYPSARAMREDLERYLASRGGVPSDAAIGALVRNVRREQRQEVRRAIEARWSELGLPPSPSPSTRATALLSATSWLQGAARSRPVASAVGASLALGLLAWGAFTWGSLLGRGLDESGAPAVALAPCATEPGALDTRAVALAERANSPQLLELSVVVRPTQAVLYLDGRRLSSNPLRASLVSDGLPHTLRAEAVGFEPWSQTLPPGAAPPIEATLQPTSAPARGNRRPSVSPAAARRGAAAGGGSKKLALAEVRAARGGDRR